MSDCDDADARPEESMNAYHSVWMAHWMRTSCESTSGVYNHFSFDDEKKKDGLDNKQASVQVQADEPRKDIRLDVLNASPSDFSKHSSAWRCPGGLRTDSDGPHSAKVGAVTEIERVKMRNKALSMKSLNLSNVRKWQSFQMSNIDERKKSILTSKKDLSFNGRHLPISQIDDRTEFGVTSVRENEADFSSRVLALDPIGVKCLLRTRHPAEGVSQRSGDLVRPDESPKKKSFPVSRTSQENHTASTSNLMLYGFETQGFPLQNKGRNREIKPLTSNKCITKSNFATIEHKNCNYHAYSTFLVHDEKMDDQLTARYSGSPSLEQNGESQQLCDPSTSDVRFPIFIGEQDKRCNFPVCGFLPSHSCPPAVIKSEELNYGSHSLHQMPKCSVHDGETLRICTTVDSVKALPGSPPKISQTTHHFLTTKKRDVNLSEGCKMLRDVSTKLKGNAFYELSTLPLDFCHDTNLGAKLQSQRNSGATEVTGDSWNAKPGSEGLIKELSAETDTINIDDLQARNSLPGYAGAASYLSNKDVRQKHAKPQATMASLGYLSRVYLSKKTMASLGKMVGSGKAEANLPDMNQEPPASAERGGMDDKELSSSRTESFEVEHLLSLAEQPDNSNFSHRDSPQCLEPDSRWVKRLKVTASDSVPHGTKYSKMGDASTSEKVNKFRKIMNHSSSSSQDMVHKYFGKGQMDNKTEVVLSNGESSSIDLVKERLDLTYPWIHRWCHNKAAAQLAKSGVNLVCEPQTSKADLYEIEKKQFPSIAAMALMGKAMNGSQPCEFRRRGSSVVWNTEGF